ncbi:MAG: FAD-dependent oxidoreductase [Bacteroidales bacterium]|jgi:NADPH-dependent 2,4-dienoyl-CoA reductase/sulfur reductase-like enzyme/rhodanese-related sulfurtransferase|nr:FAD-dependent oxidoreductase [Bacteroidales bacterium]
MKKYVIIGGVAGGATVAARLRRMDEDAEIILFEKSNFISFANCGMPYYIGDVIQERNHLLLQTPVSFGNRFNVEVRVLSEVMEIHPDRHTVIVKHHKTGKVYEEKYDKLVLSPGALPVMPPIEGIDLPGVFTLRSMEDADTIKQYVNDTLLSQSHSQQAVVIGGGFIGIEMAENLARIGFEVTIVEKARQILTPLDDSMAIGIEKCLVRNGIQVILNESVKKISKQPKNMTLHLENGQTLDARIVIVSVGVRPDTRLAQAAGLKIGSFGGIWVNQYLQTSDTDIYAVGDAIEFLNPISNQSYCCYLAGPANKQARFCADNMVFGNKIAYKGSIATAIAKVFDMTAAAAGLSVALLERNNISFLTSITHAASHAGYYPDAKPLTIKINFAPDTGKLLGAQVIGYEGVDKRIDLLSAVISRGGTIYDLIDIEHAYAPPYSSAKDPVTVAGYVAENILTGRMNIIHSKELQCLLQNPQEREKLFLVDVRTIGEYRAGTIENAVNYPLDELREFLDDIPRDKTIVVFCAVGLRGYVASRILRQSGFEHVYNLSGGIALYS